MAIESLELNSIPAEARLISISVKLDYHKLQWQEQLIPASYSLNSNVPALYLDGSEMAQPFHQVVPYNTQPDQMEKAVTSLVVGFYDRVNEISDKATEILLGPDYPYAAILARMSVKHDRFTSAKTERNSVKRKLAGKVALGGNETMDGLNARLIAIQRVMAETGIHSKLYLEFVKWLDIIPLIGYNSARFDLGLIRSQLFPHAIRSGDAPSAIIKKNASYTAVFFKKFILLDCLQFVGPMSLASFLKSWKVEEGKGK
jgi:hypothetical protein